MNALPVRNFNTKGLKTFLHNWNFIKSAAVILAAADLFMLSFPLLNILGYEYSAVNAVLITFLSGLSVIQTLKKNELSSENLFQFLQKMFSDFLILLIIPFTLSLAAALFIKNCGLWDGVLFYLVITVPSVIVGGSLAVISFFFMRRFSRLLFVILFAAVLSTALAEFYFNVQVYFFNPVFGYYPGTIYDEALTVTSGMALYRLLNVIFFGAAGYIFLYAIINKKYYSLKASWLAAGCLILSSLFLLFFKSSLGFATTESRLRSELTGNVETRHFTIWFDSHIDREKIENLALYHEYYYREAARYLNTEPKEKIRSYIFLDASQKGRLLGSAAADFAMIWKKLICIDFGNYDATLKHEIAHCISGDFGSTPFRISGGLNMAMVEGLATAADNRYQNHTIHYMASLAYNNRYRYPVDKIFTGLNFFGINSSLSYVYSGSFIKYLIDRYGAESFKRVYQGNDYREIYGRTLAELAREYYYFIGSLNLAYNMPDEANYYFGRKTVFQKNCAHYIAWKTEQAWEVYNRGDYGKSAGLFEKLVENSDAFLPLYGYLSSLKKLKDFSGAQTVLEKNIGRFYASSYYYPLEMMKGDLLISVNDFQGAENAFRTLKEQSPSKEYYCLSLTKEKISGNRDYALRFITGSDFDRYMVLRKVNSDSVFTASVPALIGLSETVKENYRDFSEFIKNRLFVYNRISSYAAVRLSQYAIRNKDFTGARILALTAMNYKDDSDFQEILTENLKISEWFAFSSETESFNFKWVSY